MSPHRSILIAADSGDTFAYDARSGAIGDTEIRLSTQPPRLLQRVVMTVRPRHTGSMGLVDADRKGNRIDEKSFIGSSNNNEGSGEQKEISCTKINVDTRQIIRQLSTSLSDCIVSSEDIYTTQYTTQHGSTEIVVRIADLLSMTVVREIDENYDEEEEEYEILETRRGIVGLETDFFLVLENSLVPITLLHSHAVPTVQPHKDLIHVYTRDEEYFPVLRRLLRPCIALTSSVQMGRGIYGKDVEDNNNRFNSHQTTDMNNLLTCSARDVPKSDVQINVDACTFDKVLLFLEHEVRLSTPHHTHSTATKSLLHGRHMSDYKISVSRIHFPINYLPNRRSDPFHLLHLSSPSGPAIRWLRCVRNSMLPTSLIISQLFVKVQMIDPICLTLTYLPCSPLFLCIASPIPLSVYLSV